MLVDDTDSMLKQFKQIYKLIDIVQQKGYVFSC